MTITPPCQDDQFSEQESIQRRDEVLRRMLSTPYKKLTVDEVKAARKKAKLASKSY